MADRLCIYPEFYRRNPPFTLFLSFSLFFSERQKEREREREREEGRERGILEDDFRRAGVRWSGERKLDCSLNDSRTLNRIVIRLETIFVATGSLLKVTIGG